MVQFQRKPVSNEVEKRIITGMIVSSSYCRNIVDIINMEYFHLDYAAMIAGWVSEYFFEYEKAPDIHIEDIYDIEKEKLDPALQDNIEEFLKTISEEYAKKDKLNVEYITKQTKDYFNKRSLEILFEKGNKLMSLGKVDRAKNLLETRREVEIETSETFNPFSEMEIKLFDADDTENILFRLDGAVGELLKDFKRSWLVTFTAPEKRGKSWTLQEIVMQALENRLKVFWFSLEMNNASIKDRLYKRLTASNIYSKDLIIPVFDCHYNQDGTCKKARRINKTKLIIDKVKPKFNERINYSICNVCRGTDEYEAATWFTKVKQEKSLDNDLILAKASVFKRLYGDNLRVRTFPPYSANSTNITQELKLLEYTEGFIPDVIVIDYIDILGPEDNKLSERGNIDATWKQFKRMASERNCLVVTADQSNKISNKKNSIDATDVSEDKRKNAHVDMKVAINQTDEEKENKIIRYGILLHRHNQFLRNRQAMILQDLSISQVILDSEIIFV